jgi:hypothetical protein
LRQCNRRRCIPKNSQAQGLARHVVDMVYEPYDAAFLESMVHTITEGARFLV